MKFYLNLKLENKDNKQTDTSEGITSTDVCIDYPIEGVNEEELWPTDPCPPEVDKNDCRGKKDRHVDQCAELEDSWVNDNWGQQDRASNITSQGMSK